MSEEMTSVSESMTSVSESMTSERAVEQLRTLIEDAESHRDADGSLDHIYQDDIEALKYAIAAIKTIDVMHESLTEIIEMCVSG